MDVLNNKVMPLLVKLSKTSTSQWQLNIFLYLFSTIGRKAEFRKEETEKEKHMDEKKKRKHK